VAKVTIGGQVYEFDRTRKPLSEMLALEKALGVPYGEWERLLEAGSARALAGFVWLVWRRDGRDVAFADIESGEIEVDLAGFGIEEDPEPENPTEAAAPTPASGTGPGGTSSGSASSASGRGRSGSSTPPSSKP
jgi:hypothetical protein